MFKFLVVVLGVWVIGAFVIKQYGNHDPKPELKVVTKAVTNPGIPFGIKVFHDDKRDVTCYYAEHTSSSALACLPDKELSH